MSSRDDLVASVSATALDVDRVEYMVGWCAGNGANFDAAFLSEVLCAVRPEEARFWNNLGLFMRDANAELAQDLEDDDEQGWAEVHRGWERSYEAYTKALEIAPENPAFLNDGAVLLHYYLERDYDTAIAMYDEAKALAEAQLEAGGLSAEERPIVEIALRDAVNNRRILEQKIAAEKEAEGGEG